jgi:hypothetical protein
MDKYLKHLPTAIIVFLAIPFLMLLMGIHDGEFDPPGQTFLAALRFIFNDSLFSHALSYLQAPVVMGLVLRYHSPAAQGIPGDGPLKLPNNWGTWALVAVCFMAASSAYLSRYNFAADQCSDSGLCSSLSRDLNIDLSKVPGGISAQLQRYCSILIASTTAVLGAVFVGTPTPSPTSMGNLK